MFTKFKTSFQNLPPLVQILLTVATVLAIIWATVTLYHRVSNQAAIWADNAQDTAMTNEVSRLETIKKENQVIIDAMKADNINLRIEVAKLTEENKIIKQSIEDDGKIVEEEQKKIDNAIQKYRNEKDSCAVNTDPDAYVKCVCAKLGVACN